MRRRPTSNDDDEGGLDSLLDTMTNVVGILVMVLIATQLGVKEAVVRIAEADVVDTADVEEARQKLKRTTNEQKTIQSQLDDLQISDDDKIKRELEKLREQLKEKQLIINREEEVANTFAIKIQEDSKKAEEAKEEIANAKERRESLQKEVTSLLEEEATLKALLDKTPDQKPLPAKVVSLPNPRPAPDGIRQVTFLCTKNRVYPINADETRTKAQKLAVRYVEDGRLYGGPAVGVDGKRLIERFERSHLRLRDDFFDVKLYASGIYPRLRFVPREDGGATVKEVLTPKSRFQRMLYVLDKNKYYGRFIVLPDSFEVYLAARSMADQSGLLSGWDPQGQTWEYTTSLGGPVLFGPKPPPKPPNPNAKPAPKKKPANVID